MPCFSPPAKRKSYLACVLRLSPLTHGLNSISSAATEPPTRPLNTPELPDSWEVCVCTWRFHLTLRTPSWGAPDRRLVQLWSMVLTVEISRGQPTVVLPGGFTVGFLASAAPSVWRPHLVIPLAKTYNLSITFSFLG